MAFVVAAANTHDQVCAAGLLRRAAIPHRLIADRSYDTRKLRDRLAQRGCEPVIPTNPGQLALPRALEWFARFVR
ncbi:MAG: transposase [Gammaproteobacteria bacterium]